MKKKTISLQTHYWSTNIYNCPYEFIIELFDIADIEYYKNEINNYFIFANKNRINNKQSASNVIYISAVLFSALKACYKIFLNSDDFKKRKLLIKDVDREDYYLSSLSRKEYINPYLVFKKIFDEFKLNDIEYVLFDTMNYSMSKSSNCCNQGSDIEILVYHRLLEACWLINERLKRRSK